MNRPCFSLGVLLSSLAVCLLAVGSANSQTGLDMHSPPCLMCPYAGHAYAFPTPDAIAEPTADDAPSSDANVEVEDADYDLDYDSDYDYSDYDYSDYDYSDYDYSDASDDTDDNDYLNYDEADYQRMYEEGAADAVAPSDEALSSDPAPAVTDEYVAFDNYDYEDYFAEVYGTVEDGTEAEAVTATDAAVAETPAADFPVVANEAVDAFDYFDAEAFEPAAPQQDPVSDHADSDAAIYDLRTSYDDSYDEVMAPTIEAASDESLDFSGTDHCFGGYADAYQSEYRCDLADAYQSFYHDGTDPSTQEPASEAIVAEPVAEPALQSGASVMPEFSLVVEPYVAMVMDRVGNAWQQFSLDAIVAKAASEVAKLPVVLSQGETVPQLKSSIADYVDCHVEAGVCEPSYCEPSYCEPSYCEPSYCEIDCFAPWELAQPVGSGVEKSNAATAEPTDLEAELIDTVELDRTKALIRDLRTRLNAARQSPPLR